MIHLRSRTHRDTIKRKLLFINMIVAILPVVIFGLLITRVYDDAVNKRTKQSVQDSSVVIADRITRVLKDAENCSNYLTVNINKVLETYKAGNKITLAQQKKITNELYVAKIVFDEIDSVAFVSSEDKVFVSDTELLENKEALLESAQLMQLTGTSGKSIWFACETREYLVKDISKPVLTLGKKVVQINTGKTLGYIFLNVDISEIESNLVNQLINYQLIDENKVLISSAISSKYIDERSVQELLTKADTNHIQKYMGRNYYISQYDIAAYHWKLIGITDLNEFNLEANKIFYLILVVAVAVILFEFLVSNYLSRIITVPLQKLKNGAEEIANGNMKLRLSLKSKDEIGQLGNSFNYMAEQVQELLKKVDYEARKKREYELSLLQEQVKPHFLYNTLDIVIKLSEMNRNVEARRVVKKLADYYRNSLSDSQEIITIRKEVKIVEDYLELQRIRYADVFTYKLEVEEEILEILIPKLTLQPLIENAIYHGLKYKAEAGVLRITGKKVPEGVVLAVEDNGVGMKQEDCDLIFQNKSKGRFGVYSVNHRIKLFFGQEYGIKAFSQEGQGMRIEILLPAREALEDTAHD